MTSVTWSSKTYSLVFDTAKNVNSWNFYFFLVFRSKGRTTTYYLLLIKAEGISSLDYAIFTTSFKSWRQFKSDRTGSIIWCQMLWSRFVFLCIVITFSFYYFFVISSYQIHVNANKAEWPSWGMVLRSLFSNVCEAVCKKEYQEGCSCFMLMPGPFIMYTDNVQ